MTSPNERPRLAARLAELEAEHASGEALLQHLAAEQQRVRDSLLRINGAIQVLRELLADDSHQDSGPDHPA